VFKKCEKKLNVKPLIILNEVLFACIYFLAPRNHKHSRRRNHWRSKKKKNEKNVSFLTMTNEILL
jgi:hypothetical protein